MPTNTIAKVPLLDLRAQYDTIRPEVDAAVRGVMESCHFIGGPEVAALEQEVARYSQAAHAVACASGTDAILLALWALNIGPGDEVICPTYTFFATGGYTTKVGAKPVYAEIDPVTYNMDPEHVRKIAKKCM